jgi:hypothetical protein
MGWTTKDMACRRSAGTELAWGQTSRRNNVMSQWGRRGALWVLLGLPVLSVLLNALAWLRHGVDLPIYDDWFGYVTGLKGSFGAQNLFKPLNDTLAPVGYFFDALAQRYLDGNMLPYQLLSMLVVLGTLLGLQWVLLRRALGDTRLAAACFALTLLMLQPDSYWGQQSLAYHQALPLVFLLGALALSVSDARVTFWRLASVALLGLLAGFSYVSGAFAVLASGSVLWAVARWSRSPSRSLPLWGGAVLGGAGAVAAACQFGLAVYPNPGLTHRPDAALALPHEADFWWFMAGKLGRSLALPLQWPWWSLAVVLVVALATLVVLWRLLRPLCGPVPVSRERWWTAAVVAPLLAGIGAYLMLVAAGRTHLRPAQIQAGIDVFAFGFERFHYFWATLWWPWLAAGVAVLLGARQRNWQGPAVVLGLLASALLLHRGVLDHDRAYRAIAQGRQQTLACLLDKMQRGEVVDCPEFATVDMALAYAHGLQMGSSFTRTAPVLPMPLGIDDPAPWWRASRASTGLALHALRADETDGAVGAMRLHPTSPDPQMLIRTGQQDAMGRCLLLSVHAELQIAQADVMQVFYRPKGQPGYTEAASQVRAVAAGAPQRVVFQLLSVEGFEDELRVDPVNSPQEMRLRALEVRCHLLRAPTRP